MINVFVIIVKKTHFAFSLCTETHHFLKIDHVVNKRLVALVCECHIWKEIMRMNGGHVCPTMFSYETQRAMYSDTSTFTVTDTFEKEGHEGDDWRLQFGDSESVGPVVSGRVLLTNKVLKPNTCRG